MQRIIHIHSDAAPKPAAGHACNGCGVCCATDPCPLGMLVSRRRSGACAALVWSADAAVYRCGLIDRPAAHLWRVARPLSPLLSRLARRYISAGSGCDSDLTASPAA